MTIVNPVPPIGTYVAPFMPLENITPFTLRDGNGYLEVLLKLRLYINHDIVPFINENFNKLGDEFQVEVNKLIDEVNLALINQTTDVDTKIADLTEYVDDAVNSIINSSITVQDPVMKGIIQNVASQTRVLLDSLYVNETDFVATTTDVDALKTLTSTGRLSQANVNDRIDKLEKVPRIFAGNYGIVGDGSDESAKVATFLADGITKGAECVFARGVVVSVGAQIAVPSHSRINLNGGTLRMLGVGATDMRMLMLDTVTDIAIYNGFLDGNLTAYVPATEQRHNICIRNASDIVIRDVKSFNAKGDGIYVGDQLVGLSRRITLDNVWCDANYRQGLSISHVSGMNVSNSIFSNTIGTAPQAGVDIEPNSTTIACENIEFVNCRFFGNAGAGVEVSLQSVPTARQAGFTFTGCVVDKNFNGYDIRDGTDIQIMGGSASSNTQYGVKFNKGYGSLTTGVKVDNVAIRSNGRGGVFADTTEQIKDITISNCTIADNSTSAAGAYYGIYLTPLAGSTLVHLIGNSFSGTSQGFAIRTNANVAFVSLVDNRYMDIGTGQVTWILLGDDQATRVHYDMAGKLGPHGPTANRPVLASGIVEGYEYFDTTLHKPVYYTGATNVWKDATGTVA